MKNCEELEASLGYLEFEVSMNYRGRFVKKKNPKTKSKLENKTKQILTCKVCWEKNKVFFVLEVK